MRSMKVITLQFVDKQIILQFNGPRKMIILLKRKILKTLGQP